MNDCETSLPWIRFYLNELRIWARFAPAIGRNTHWIARQQTHTNRIGAWPRKLRSTDSVRAILPYPKGLTANASPSSEVQQRYPSSAAMPKKNRDQQANFSKKTPGYTWGLVSSLLRRRCEKPSEHQADYPLSGAGVFERISSRRNSACTHYGDTECPCHFRGPLRCCHQEPLLSAVCHFRHAVQNTRRACGTTGQP